MSFLDLFYLLLINMLPEIKRKMKRVVDNLKNFVNDIRGAYLSVE